MTKGTRQIAFPRTRRTGNEKILPFIHKVKGGEAFHLVTVQFPVYGIVNLLNISLVTECRIPCKLVSLAMAAWAR